MKVGQIGPTFVDPGKMVNFWSVKSVVSFSTLKMRKSKKNEHLYTHTLTCMRENVMVGANLPPPESNRVKYTCTFYTSRCFKHFLQLEILRLKTLTFIPLDFEPLRLRLGDFKA